MSGDDDGEDVGILFVEVEDVGGDLKRAAARKYVVFWRRRRRLCVRIQPGGGNVVTSVRDLEKYVGKSRVSNGEQVGKDVGLRRELIDSGNDRVVFAQ